MRKTAGELAQKLVEDKLRDLPSGYDVLTEIDITARNDSELDVAVVTPSGMLITVEIKAGSLEANSSGRINRHYSSGNKDVTHQLNNQKGIVRSRLSGFKPRPNHEHFLVLPEGELIGQAIGINNSQVIDSKRFSDIVSIIIDTDEASRQQGYFADRRKLIDFLKNQYQIKQSLVSISETLDLRSRENAAGLATWVPRISSSSPIVIVEAPAGAGKTQLAAALLQKAVDEGKRAWYINYNRNIVERMQAISCAHKVSFIGTWHELACEKTHQEIEGHEDLSVVFNQLSNDLIEILNEGRDSIDYIIIDDAQDLKFEWLEALTNALSDTGTFYVLTDPEVRIYESEPLPEFSDYVKLTSNESARVPQSFLNWINKYELTRSQMTTSSPYDAPEPQLFIYTGKSELLRQTKNAIEQALKEGFTEDQIAILTYTGKNSSEVMKSTMLGKYRLKLHTGFNQYKQSTFSDGTLYTDTIRRFKGLQAPCVILTEVDFEELSEEDKSLLYLGLTRASMNLKIVLSQRANLSLAKVGS